MKSSARVRELQHSRLIKESRAAFDAGNVAGMRRAAMQALRLFPASAPAQMEYASLLAIDLKYAEARDVLLKLNVGIRCQSYKTAVLTVIAQALYEIGCWQESESILINAINHGNHSEARIGYGKLLARRGMLAEGMSLLNDPRLFSEYLCAEWGVAKIWEGESLSGKSIGIICSEGVGDEVLYSQCISDLLNMGAQVFVKTNPRLICIFNRSFPGATCFSKYSKQEPKVNYRAVGIGLSAYFRNDWSKFRAKPYLKPDAISLERWRTRFSRLGAGLIVGIAWRGGADPIYRAKRTIPLNAWDEILKIPNVHFVSLQYGECAGDLAKVKDRLGVQVHDWPDADALGDMDEHAAQIAACDLVISVDQTAVHFAGALGVPAWVMLPYAHDWRWFSNRDDSPWYDSIRLYRQATVGDWSPVIKQVAAQLANMSQGARTDLVENSTMLSQAQAQAAAMLPYLPSELPIPFNTTERATP